jgi:hypothetical protein
MAQRLAMYELQTDLLIEAEGGEVSQLDDLVQGWKSHFWAADHEIEWRAVEVQKAVWLNDNTLLAGTIDALGYNGDGKLFFGEWKTANPREKATWKQMWRMTPQSLTYGVLMARDPDTLPDCSTFTVRKAFKSPVATFDHAWYTYTPAELRHWEGELLRIADEIRAYRAAGKEPWPTNFQRCFQFGTNYACPFYENGCAKQDWAAVPTGAVVKDREQYIADALAEVPFKRGLVVLRQSTIHDWLGCREMYRKRNEEGLVMPAGDALKLGTDFHGTIAEYYRSLIATQGAPVEAQKFVLGVGDSDSDIPF